MDGLMSANVLPQPGTLSVTLMGDSDFLGLTIPIEVRDSNMQLVGQASTVHSLELPEGLYEVSAILEDGRRHHKLAHIRPGEVTRLELTAKWDSGNADSFAPLRNANVALYERPRFIAKLESLSHPRSLHPTFTCRV